MNQPFFRCFVCFGSFGHGKRSGGRTKRLQGGRWRGGKEPQTDADGTALTLVQERAKSEKRKVKNEKMEKVTKRG